MRQFASVALIIGIGMASAAQAMPASHLPDGTSSTITVGWRCGGPGWHMNPWGRCVPNRVRGYYGPPRFYHPHWRYHHWHRW